MTAGPDLDPYLVLGVDDDASTVEIRAAWRRVVKTSHPDAGGDPESFRQLQQAFELLGDPERRASYDRQRSGSTPAGSDPARRGAASPPSSHRGPKSPVPDQGSTATAASVRARWIGVTRTWELPPAEMPRSFMSPAVEVAGGLVVARTNPLAGAPMLTAIDSANGAQRWMARFAAPVESVAVLAGTVVASTSDAVVHGLAIGNGVTLWERPLSAPVCGVTVLAAPAGEPEGQSNTAVVAAGNSLTAIDAAGSTVWVARLGHQPVWMLPTSATLMVGTTGDTVVALDRRTGRTRWWIRHRIDPAIGGAEVAGVVWIGDGQRRLVGLDPSTGAALHVVDVGEAVLDLHRLGNRLAVRTVSAALLVLGATGAPRWKVQFSAGFSAPCVVDGVVVVAVADGSLRMLSARTGAELHHVVVDLGAARTPDTLWMDDALVIVTATDGAAVGMKRVG